MILITLYTFLFLTIIFIIIILLSMFILNVDIYLFFCTISIQSMDVKINYLNHLYNLMNNNVTRLLCNGFM